jgi:predicted O-linked N-acetylglucosamine transferase (SPINDLY family)
VTKIFQSLGVLSSQLELRGMSFHVDVLKQYADIDICLDTFPFSGGLTSLEALNQGVPVITLPSADRAVSRQTFAFYQLMGYTKCIASNEADYIVRAECCFALKPDPGFALKTDPP